jgi:NADH-quinone oxidoreductase subunit G
MAKLEIDGRPVEVPDNSTIMDASNKLGIYVPHFCYHRKLSIAANCRMCLVQVEKAPKPLPACATPVTEGMKVHTHSEAAINAQKGVMEFLLINHPLDCPICDQGGECQLQDLAVGYGASSSRYDEAKRVVANKELGPLVSAAEMTRCIHCTRCVRFGQEIAGVMELGMAGRGERAEILPFVARTVDSELSGNMIDVCPVGALTSKPFRYRARTWELARRKSIAPHDALGSNLVVQVKGDRVMRVLPLENEDVNECWLSDRDRFSYEGLNAASRLSAPMLKRDGKWEEVDWSTALEFIAAELARIRATQGSQAIGALATPQATLEELYLLGKLARGVGGTVDFRLRQADFSMDGKLRGAPWLGMKIREVPKLDRILLIGSILRKEQPLFAHRVRQAVGKGAQCNLLNAVDDKLLMRVANKAIVPPSRWTHWLAQLIKASAEIRSVGVPPAAAGVSVDEVAREIAQSMASGQNGGIFLGHLAQHHPQAAELHRLAQDLARIVGARIGFFSEGANGVGGYLVGAMPSAGPESTMNASHGARAAMHAADLVVVLSPFRHGLEYAQALLPVSPFTETAGSFVNMEGRLQNFQSVVRPLGETRPAWKVLRVLGSLLHLPGFDYDNIDEIRADCLAAIGPLESRLDNAIEDESAPLGASTAHDAPAGLERIGEVPIYQVDGIVRRAESLQLTHDAQAAFVSLPGTLVEKLGLRQYDLVRIRQRGGEATLPFLRDDKLPPNCARIPAACAQTSGLAALFGEIEIERVAAQQKARA